MGIFSDFFLRRKLNLVIKALPHALKKNFGASDFYTAGQVRGVAGAMHLPQKYVNFALATACARSEYNSAIPTAEASAYDATRKEIARLFWLEPSDLNCGKLTSVFKNPIGLGNNSDILAGSLDGTHDCFDSSCD